MKKTISRGWGTAGLILSIASFLLCWFPFLGFLLAGIAIACAVMQIIRSANGWDVFTIILALIVIFINSFFIVLAFIFGITLFSILLLLSPFA